jgi:hypothetical protein
MVSDPETHHPIPLRWMTWPEVAAHRRIEAALIVYASMVVCDARRVGDDHLYRLARDAYEDARARWQEFTP